MITDNTSFYQFDISQGIIGLAVYIFMVIALWMVFSKAGIPGWTAIIPIVNTYFLLKVAQRSGWWLLLFLIPIVNIVIAIIVSLDVSKRFGHGGAFGFFLLFFIPIIGYPIIGFGSDRYQPQPR